MKNNLEKEWSWERFHSLTPKFTTELLSSSGGTLFYKTGIQISGVESPGGQKEASDVCSIYFQQECWDNSMERIFF